MKKNNVMRIASALLVAVLLTTCAISGTFAKYTTTASGDTSARVAKWGFGTATEIEFDLFSDNYNDVVVGTDGALVVAPGTTGTADIVLVADDEAAATEVAYTFDANVEITGDDALLAKLVWKLDGEKVGENGTYAELKEAINDTFDKTYTPGQTPDTTFSITWEWAFDGDATTDTQLGADGEATVTVTISFTATQTK